LNKNNELQEPCFKSDKKQTDVSSGHCKYCALCGCHGKRNKFHHLNCFTYTNKK